MTTTQTHAALLSAHWYSIDKHGAATLCVDEDDAKATAIDSQTLYPHNGPYRAVQMAPIEPVQAGELPEPELGYIKTDKSNQPAYSARQMRAALSARKPLAGLTREQMEAGRHQVFSTNNPFCPCDSKTFRKVSEWTEREFCRINGLEVKT